MYFNQTLYKRPDFTQNYGSPTKGLAQSKQRGSRWLGGGSVNIELRIVHQNDY